MYSICYMYRNNSDLNVAPLVLDWMWNSGLTVAVRTLYSDGISALCVQQARIEILLTICNSNSCLFCVKGSWLPSPWRGKWIMC